MVVYKDSHQPKILLSIFYDIIVLKVIYNFFYYYELVLQQVKFIFVKKKWI